jgi:integrase/recombinase XerD
MNNISAGEQLISELVFSIAEETTNYINAEKMKSIISRVITKYNVTKAEIMEGKTDIADKIDLYIAAKRLDGLSLLTLDGYRLELNIFANKINKNVHEISAADIRVYLSELPSTLKMSTVGQKLTILKSFFVWLTGEEILQRDPTKKLKAPKVEKRLPKALSIEELEILRESCKTVRQRAFIEVMYATGCRLSEIHDLNISDIDFTKMSTNVIGKGNKEREVYFSWKAKFHLQKYLRSRNDDCPALMVTERKPYRRLGKRGIQREIGKIAAVAGLDHKVSPHVLRHTFATLTLNNGAKLEAVQELLGHSSPETTLRYAQITEERKREQHKKFLVQ